MLNYSAQNNDKNKTAKYIGEYENVNTVQCTVYTKFEAIEIEIVMPGTKKGDCCVCTSDLSH